MLTFENAGKSFGGRPVIESVAFSLQAGEIVCLTWPSGIGKTTILEMAAEVTKPDTGAVRRTVAAAMMFQDDVLIPWLNAGETVAYILPASMPERERRDRAAFWLEKFGLDVDARPAAMSGGMRRRLSLARTFAAGRPLILLDEPFAFLDEKYCALIAEEIAAHAEKGCAILLSTHTTGPLRNPRLATLPASLAGSGRPALRTLTADRSPVVILAD